MDRASHLQDRRQFYVPLWEESINYIFFLFQDSGNSEKADDNPVIRYRCRSRKPTGTGAEAESRPLVEDHFRSGSDEMDVSEQRIVESVGRGGGAQRAKQSGIKKGT